MQAVDMDRVETWPVKVTDFLSAHSGQLAAEREADREYSLAPSTHRIVNDPPRMPRLNEAKACIASVMTSRELIAFHATRLIDFEDVRRNGLRVLDLGGSIARLERHLRDAGAIDAIAELHDAVARTHEADRAFRNREGAVWATPHRTSLHDGGCDEFYRSFGGEAIRHIAGHAPGDLRHWLERLGTPAVAIVRYPTYGWCETTWNRLPASMIELYLQHEGILVAVDYGWDVMITRDVPAENIVAVVAPDDLTVAA